MTDSMDSIAVWHSLIAFSICEALSCGTVTPGGVSATLTGPEFAFKVDDTVFVHCVTVVGAHVVVVVTRKVGFGIEKGKDTLVTGVFPGGGIWNTQGFIYDQALFGGK